jgi:outer membrane protein OmpA-like peptidoglycan-associated protein
MKFIYLLMCFLSLVNLQNSFCQGHVSVYTIYFEKNSYNINKKFQPLLKNLAILFNNDSCRMIKIYGYSDTVGSKNYNEALSKKRVYSVFNFLHSSNKFDTTKVYMVWLGESEDSYDLHFSKAHIQQRCVDIWVLFNRNASIPKKVKKKSG